MIRQMIEDDIGATFGPNPFDSYTAHQLLKQLLPVYYDAQEAHDRNEAAKFRGDTAPAADRARGRFFIAVCEWARSQGAVLPQSGGVKP